MAISSSIVTDSALLAVADIAPNPWNKRRPLDQAFADSIIDQGVLCPILVRPGDGSGVDYEIICGERRWQACKENGIETIPALVRAMDDQAAQLCTLIENTHREDMAPWQEAQLIGDLLAKPDWDIAIAAAATGWSESLIRRRAKLLELSPSWRAELEAGAAGKYHAWTIGHFETLTAFNEAKQEAFYDQWEYDDEMRAATVQELRTEMSRAAKTLKHAPWDLDDATLCPEAGSCTDCPIRTGANGDLFAETDAKVKAGDRCLKPECYQQKEAAHLERQAAVAQEKHPNLIKISKEHGGDRGALGPNQYEKVKKSDKGAVPALVVSGKGVGGVEWVKPIGQAGKAKADKGGEDRKAERIAQYEKRRIALTLKKLAAIVEDEGKELEFEKGAYEILIEYCLAYGVEVGRYDGDEEKHIRSGKPFTVEQIWESVADDMVNKLGANQRTPTHEGGPELDDEAKLIAWMVDADLKALKKEADEELPLPVSLGGLGGKRKTAADLGQPDRYDAADELEDDLAADGDEEVD